MLTLYIQDGCSYCQRVLDTLEKLHLTAKLKNVKDARNAGELVRRGGELQTPYLVDDTWGHEMYESENIVHYLEETYGEPLGSKLHAKE